MKRHHSNEFKFKVAIEAIKGKKTVNELAQEYGVVPSLISKWKLALMQCGAKIFDGNDIKLEQSQLYDKKLQELYAQIGKLSVENEFLKKNSVV
jgi:transposase